MEKNKVALYVRANDEFALNTQIEELKLVCKKRNFKIYHIYSDIGVSGRTTENRYGYRKMMNDLIDKKFNMIMITKVCRISRDIVVFEDFLQELKKYNCSLELPTGNFDNEYKKYSIPYKEIIMNLFVKGKEEKEKI